ncbi:MAG: RluA family pseudouridine synthase [Alphaproteobacteria bacterium]|nr:RluA family pseudouridine synthase [Alphaproteobacteria bacterium]
MAGDRRHVVIAGAGTDRLDRALSAALPDISRSRLKALIQAGHVWHGDRRIGDPGARVKPGQSFDIIVPEPVSLSVEPQDIDLPILFEDEAVLVVDKPAGLVVHPGAGQPDGTLVNALLFHCGDRLSGIGGVLRPGIVHRLDKDTSGLMVVAKTDEAHMALSRQFADRSLSRAYHALVQGIPRPAEGELSWPIGRDPGDRKRMAALARGGKPALTRYRRLQCFGDAAALLDCTLATGRTHQIRVHLARLGHPVIGDPVYGRPVRRRDAAGAVMRDFPRQALHARQLRFRHPRTGEPVTFDSDLPADMARLRGDLARSENPCSGR